MKTYTKIMSDSSLRARYEEEKKDLVELLFERAEIFLSEAEECKLETLGFTRVDFCNYTSREKSRRNYC